MRVYCGRNLKGTWKASLDYEKVRYFDCLTETDLDVLHDKVFFVHLYRGFDYDYERGSIYDVVRNSPCVYHSVCELKKEDPMWLEVEKAAKENPKEYHVTPFCIASDYCGEPFMYGDVMEGKISVKIIAVKLV